MATSRDAIVRSVAGRTNPKTGRPYGRERAEAIIDHAVRTRDPRLEAARRRRLLAQVDRALAKQGVKPPRRQAVPSQRTQQTRHRAQQEHSDAIRSWTQLRDAIKAEGGIVPNADYHASEIPRELGAGRGRGLAPDEMASVLGTHGLHYGGDVELFADIERRRERVRDTHETAGRVAPRTGPATVCTDACRDERGMFERCAAAASRAQRICRRVLRDSIGRFKPAPALRRKSG